MHTAILAREIRRGIPGMKVPSLDTFLIRNPTERAAEMIDKVFNILSSLGTKMTPKEASKLLRKARRKRAGKKSRRSN